MENRSWRAVLRHLGSSSAHLGRQLRAACDDRGFDYSHFITTNYRTVYYLTGSLAPADTPLAFALCRDGGSILVTPSKSEATATTIIA